MSGVDLMNVREFLDAECVPFEVLPHHSTYTAQHLAHTLDVPGDNVAKTVLLNVDNELVLAVLPATHQVSVSMLQDCLPAGSVELATEEELMEVFPDCERGVAPPFGKQYGLVTIVDRSLADDEHIVFEGNSHTEAIYLRYHDYARIEQPRIESFTTHI
jgi:Ala-tRNA(Pro) deacylase